MEVATLRELIRHLQGFQSLREVYGITEITSPTGDVYSIYDIEYLYSCRTLLSPRQCQAIELFLYRNIRERDVAEMMNVAVTNPIAIYATQGLTRLCAMLEADELPGYRSSRMEV